MYLYTHVDINIKYEIEMASSASSLLGWFKTISKISVNNKLDFWKFQEYLSSHQNRQHGLGSVKIWAKLGLSKRSGPTTLFSFFSLFEKTKIIIQAEVNCSNLSNSVFEDWKFSLSHVLKRIECFSKEISDGNWVGDFLHYRVHMKKFDSCTKNVCSSRSFIGIIFETNDTI